MNIDLITKLAKLANNNPNEHEANLAARKVCKLLAEGEFKFNNNSGTLRDKNGNPIYQPSQKQQEYYQSASNPSGWNPYGEFFRARQEQWRNPSYYKPPQQAKTAEEVHREKEEKYKSTYDWVMWDEIPEDPPKPKQEPNNYWYGQNPEWNYSNEKRSLKCKICGHFKMTRFRGPADMWECMECRGKTNDKTK